MIFEEAIVKCGTEERLWTAVSEGRVKKARHGAIDIFYFPTVKVGREESLTTEEEGRRSKAISGASYDAIGDLAQTFSWSITSTQAQLENPQTKQQAETELWDKMNKSWIDLGKMSKAADKTISTAMMLDPMPPSLKPKIDDVVRSQQAVETVVHELSYILKFRVTMSGEHLSIGAAQTLHNRAAEKLKDLFDANKILKMLTPKAPASLTD